jgi:hypothetical protein
MSVNKFHTHTKQRQLMGILRTNKMGQVFNESTELQGAYEMLIVTG